MYQSYNIFMRRQWEKLHHRLPTPDQSVERALRWSPTVIKPDLSGGLTQADVVHVVIEARKIIASKGKTEKTEKTEKSGKNEKSEKSESSQTASIARYILNLEEVESEIRKIPGVIVTSEDLSVIGFKKQVSVAHSAGVFVSMHGAGTTHIYHSAIGENNCCGLVELQPDKNIGGFYHAHGFGNIARNLGMGYVRHVSADGSTTPQGTTLDARAVGETVRRMVEQVRGRGRGSGRGKGNKGQQSAKVQTQFTEEEVLGHRTCVNDVKDTSLPVLQHTSFPPLSTLK